MNKEPMQLIPLLKNKIKIKLLKKDIKNKTLNYLKITMNKYSY